MRTLGHLLSIAAIAVAVPCFANNLQISNVDYNPGTNEISFDISWENSWRGPGANPLFHDAVWVFVKVAVNGGPQWNHVGLDVTDEDTLDVITPGDLKGAFIRRASEGTGFITGSVKFEVSGTVGMFPDFKVFGIEMAYIPAGAYYLGDGFSDGAIHKGNDADMPYKVSDSDVMTYGNGSSDYYTDATAFTTDIPATYPNGYNAFYCMKYEISQFQWAEFLNCLSNEQQDSRTETDLSSGTWTNTYVMSNTSTPLYRNSVRCMPPSDGAPLFFFCDLDEDGVPNENNDGQNLPMTYISYDDLLAYLDWACLRPMSPLEYEKICRGFTLPVAGEYAWGTSTLTAPGDVVNPGQVDETFSNIGAVGLYGSPNANKLIRCGFAATSSSTRITSGGTYFGVMEMFGNASERTVLHTTLQESVYGDGELDILGFEDSFGITSIRYTSKGTPAAGATVSFLAGFGTNSFSRSSTTGGRGVR